MDIRCPVAIPFSQCGQRHYAVCYCSQVSSPSPQIRFQFPDFGLVAPVYSLSHGSQPLFLVARCICYVMYSYHPLAFDPYSVPQVMAWSLTDASCCVQRRTDLVPSSPNAHTACSAPTFSLPSASSFNHPRDHDTPLAT